MFSGGSLKHLILITGLGASAATGWALQETKPPKKEQPNQASPAERESDTTPPPKNPSPEAILRDLQRNRPTNAPVRSTTSRNPRLLAEEGPEKNTGMLLREGEFLNDRPGRLEREGEWWTFVFESDSNAAPQPPMRLLPNQKLESMTRAQEASTESIVFLVSGEVTLFGLQNYVLIRKSLRQRSVGKLQK